MGTFTLLMFIMALAVYALSVVAKRDGLKFVPVLVSVLSIALVLNDAEVTDLELIAVILVDFYVFLMSIVYWREDAKT